MDGGLFFKKNLIYINKAKENKIAYVLQHLVSSHNEVILSNKAG